MPTAQLASRLQAALVIALFLGSLAVIAVNALSPPMSAGRDLQARDQIRTASRLLAAAAEPVTTALLKDPAAPDLDERLRAVAAEVLAQFPNTEGGFFLGGERDRFSGYAFPTKPRGGLPQLPRNEPPPLEAPYIRLQARQSLVDDPGQSVIQDYAIGPSQVLVSVEPIGADRPAAAAAWTMIRLTGPEQLERRVSRFQLSLGLALAGMAASLLLMVNLGRSAKRQRLAEDRLRDQLRRSEHMAALGRLLAGVAHEVRTPLAGIRSTVQLWQRLPDTVRDPATLTAVIGAVDRLNDIVSRLLYFARPDQTDRQPLDVNPLLAETVKLLEAQAAGQGVTVELDLDPSLPAVTGSAGALRQVCLNLLANALQAMPAGGTLRASTAKVNSRGPNGANWAIVIRIADTGPGVSPDDRTHLFEPFFTTRSAGTGLGLALCREIVTRHGGRIELESDANPGAIFRVELPGGDGS
jgi:two-component system sensor histidine kinase HydH